MKARYIKTHNGTRSQRDWQTLEEVQAESMETLRSWLKGNDPNGDWDDDYEQGYYLDHDLAVYWVCSQSDIRCP